MATGSRGDGPSPRGVAGRFQSPPRGVAGRFQSEAGSRFQWIVIPAKTDGSSSPMKVFRMRVPLVPASTPKVMKTVEVVQQEHTPLTVKVDKSCLFAFDEWKFEGMPGGMRVGSRQDLDTICPCCGKSQRQIDDGTAFLEIDDAFEAGHEKA